MSDLCFSESDFRIIVVGDKRHIYVSLAPAATKVTTLSEICKFCNEITCKFVCFCNSIEQASLSNCCCRERSKEKNSTKHSSLLLHCHCQVCEIISSLLVMTSYTSMATHHPPNNIQKLYNFSKANFQQLNHYNLFRKTHGSHKFSSSEDLHCLNRVLNTDEGLDDNLDIDHPEPSLLHLQDHSPTTSLMSHKYSAAAGAASRK